MKTLMTCWLQNYLPFLGMVILLKYVGLGDSGNISTAGLFHLFDARKGVVYINSNQDSKRIARVKRTKIYPLGQTGRFVPSATFILPPTLELGGHLKITASLIF